MASAKRWKSNYKQKSLPCAKGGDKIFDFDGGIGYQCVFIPKTIPQSTPLTAPFTQGSLFYSSFFIFSIEINLLSSYATFSTFATKFSSTHFPSPKQSGESINSICSALSKINKKHNNTSHTNGKHNNWYTICI